MDEYDIRTLILDIGSHTTKYGFSNTNSLLDTQYLTTPSTIPSLIATKNNKNNNNNNKKGIRMVNEKDEKIDNNKNLYCFGNDVVNMNEQDISSINSIKSERGLINNRHHFELFLEYILGCEKTKTKNNDKGNKGGVLWKNDINKLYQEYHDVTPVFVIEETMSPRANRYFITQLMFEDFEVCGLCFEVAAVCNAMFYGKSTGVSIDIGYHKTIIAPVYESYCLPASVIMSKIGGKNVDDYLINEIEKGNKDVILSTLKDKYFNIQKIKEKFCFTSLDYDFHKICAEKNYYSLFDIYKPLFHIFPVEIVNIFHMYIYSDLTRRYKKNSYLLPDGKEIILKGEQFQSIEILFNPKTTTIKPKIDEENGIAKSLYNSIMKNDDDIRLDLFDNIMLCGGSSLTSGIKKRLLNEMNKLTTEKVKIYEKQNKEYAGWIGGKICTLLKTYQEKIITKDEYGLYIKYIDSNVLKQ